MKKEQAEIQKEFKKEVKFLLGCKKKQWELPRSATQFCSIPSGESFYSLEFGWSDKSKNSRGF